MGGLVELLRFKSTTLYFFLIIAFSFFIIYHCYVLVILPDLVLQFIITCTPYLAHFSTYHAILCVLDVLPSFSQAEFPLSPSLLYILIKNSNYIFSFVSAARFFRIYLSVILIIKFLKFISSFPPRLRRLFFVAFNAFKTDRSRLFVLFY